MRSISQQITERVQKAGKQFFANDNIAEFVLPNELDMLQDEVTGKVRELLRALVIDVDNDHNTIRTAQRVAKMYLKEVFKGRYIDAPPMADFPNAKECDEMYTTYGRLSERQGMRRNVHHWTYNYSVGLFPPLCSNHREMLDRDYPG